MLQQYRSTLSNDRRTLLERFRYVDSARKVVGVGSVGTRAWIALLLGRQGSDPLFLQLKEAEASVLEPFLGASEFETHGQRVVEGQRLTQAATDITLGWLRTTGPDGVDRDYYVRQLWDAKGSALVELMNPSAMAEYAKVCGQALARGARPQRRRGADRALPRPQRAASTARSPPSRGVRRPERGGLRGDAPPSRTGTIVAETGVWAGSSRRVEASSLRTMPGTPKCVRFGVHRAPTTQVVA